MDSQKINLRRFGILKLITLLFITAGYHHAVFGMEGLLQLLRAAHQVETTDTPRRGTKRKWALDIAAIALENSDDSTSQKSDDSEAPPAKRAKVGEEIIKKPYPCTHIGCQKTFDKKYNLTVHERTHTNIKPYTCTHGTCKKAFHEKGNLTRHMRLHTGEKPFKCTRSGCDKQFYRQDTLATHMRRH